MEIAMGLEVGLFHVKRKPFLGTIAIATGEKNQDCPILLAAFHVKRAIEHARFTHGNGRGSFEWPNYEPTEQLWIKIGALRRHSFQVLANRFDMAQRRRHYQSRQWI